MSMYRSEVVLITVTLCSEVSLVWICANFSVFRTVLPELWPTPPSIHTSLLLEKHYIDCRLSITLSLRLPSLYISFYTGVTPNTLNPFWYPDLVHITLIKVNLIVCFLSSPTLLQFSSLKSILASVLHMMHLWVGTTSLILSALQSHLPPSGQGWSLTSFEKHIHPNFSILLSPWCSPLQCLWLIHIKQCFLVWCTLSLSFDRLGAIKVLLVLVVLVWEREITGDHIKLKPANYFIELFATSFLTSSLQQVQFCNAGWILFYYILLQIILHWYELYVCIQKRTDIEICNKSDMLWKVEVLNKGVIVADLGQWERLWSW